MPLTLNMKASFWKRLLACSVDSLSCGIVALTITTVLALPSVLEYWFHVFLFYASRIAMEYHWQASFGKLIFNLRVIKSDGGNPSLFECCYRNFAQIFSWLPLGYGYLRILAPHQPQTVHDEVARCYVIKTRRVATKHLASQ